MPLKYFTPTLDKEPISTTGLAGGLLKPYKGFFPAQESKDSSKWFANRKTFSHQALKGLS